MTDSYAGRILPRLAALSPLTLLGGCDWALLDPQGMIGVENRSTILWATGLMLLIVVPVILATLAFAWRYRATNLAADYAPDWSHSNGIEVVIWVVPALIVASLAWIAYDTTHKLDPYRPIASPLKPVEVEVVALDWKWLFIYPEYGVASINQMAMPVGRPVHFKITAGSVMNSFFIPQLGSQVYAMAGMQTVLNLQADKAGDYDGISSNFSGDGFADMRFTAKAMDQNGFDAWIAAAKKQTNTLNISGYKSLTRPSEKAPVSYYGSVAPNLFQGILMQGMAPDREKRTNFGTFPTTPTPDTTPAHQD